MHGTIGFKTIIGTQESVYGDSSLGKLEERVMVNNLSFPLQKGFDSNGQTGFSVRVDCLPALALEQGIIGTVMPFSHSTAMGTPLAGMPTINNVQCNVFVKAPAFKQSPESAEWDSHGFFVESLAFWTEPFEVFNGNAGVMLQSQFSYVSDNFSQPVFNKVSFLAFKSIKALVCPAASFVCQALQDCPPLKNLFAFNPNVFSKVSLLGDLAFGRKNRNSKALTVDVNAQNVLPLRQFGFFFRKISDNLLVGSQSKCFASPISSQQGSEPLIVPIIFDWNSQSFFGIHFEFNKEIGFSAESLAVSGNIEFDSDSLDDCCFAFGNVAFNVANDLRIKGGIFLAC